MTDDLRAQIQAAQAEVDDLVSGSFASPARASGPIRVASVVNAPEATVTDEASRVAMIRTLKSQQAADASALGKGAAEKLVVDLVRIERWIMGAWLGVFVFFFLLAVGTASELPKDHPVGWSAAWSAAASGRLPLVAAVYAGACVWVAVLIIAFLRRAEGGAIRMLLGADRRVSTSYVQAWLWTLALVFAFVFFIWEQALSGTPIFSSDRFSLSANYLLLLGGPFAALAASQLIAQSKITTKDLQKTVSNKPSVSDLVTNDGGNVDLVDTQYLLFNGVALAIFAVALWNAPSALPVLPDGIVALTSTSALGYITKKAIQNNAPAILNIVGPPDGSPIATGTLVEITGTNFVPAGADSGEYLQAIRVKFGTAVVAAVTSEASAGSLSTRVPDLSGDGLTTRLVDVVVVTAAGVETPSYKLRVVNAAAS